MAALMGIGRSKLPPSAGRRSGEPRSHFLSAGAPLRLERHREKRGGLRANVAEPPQFGAANGMRAADFQKHLQKDEMKRRENAADKHTTPTSEGCESPQKNDFGIDVTLHK